MASGSVSKIFFDSKPFLIGHLGPNLSLHTPFTPLPDTFLVILVKRMTLKKNLPPPAQNKLDQRPLYIGLSSKLEKFSEITKE